MKFFEKVAIYFGFCLIVFAVVLLCFVNLVLGFVFTVFVVIVFVWYLKLKKKGDVYLKSVAEMLKCKFEGGKFAYGRVFGSYKGRKIEVSVNKDYDALRGFAGFIISAYVFDSAIGTLAGIKNFTSVKIEHKANIEKPFKLKDRIYVDKHFILYLPPSNEFTGLPKLSVKSLIAKIDEIIEKAEQIENSY